MESQSIFNSAPTYTEQVENSCWCGVTDPIYFSLVVWLCCAVCRLLVSWPERDPAPPALAAWSLSHWATTAFLSLVIPSSKLIQGFCYLELCKEDWHNILFYTIAKITLLPFRLSIRFSTPKERRRLKVEACLFSFQNMWKRPISDFFFPGW